MNRTNSLQKKWTIPLLIAGIVFILVMTLFPYDFFFWEMLSQLTLKEILELLQDSSNIRDILLNLLLFIPFGFGLVNLLERFEIHFIRLLFVLFFFSFGLSLTVEILQFFLPARTSTPIDLLTNTLSGMGGGLLFKNIGHQFFNQAERFFNWIKSLISIPVLTCFLIGYLILACWFSIPLQQTEYLWGLGNWDMEFPLNLGDELIGNRPWMGKIDQFCFSEKTVSDSEIFEILISKSPCESLSNFEGFLAVVDQPHFSQLPATQLNQGLRQTSEFTLIIQLATADSHQTGPARILSISKDFFERNLTLGQWRSHLSIRLRNPVTGMNGTRPEFIVPNIFSDLKTHTLLLSYTLNKIEVFIDKNFNQKYTLKLTPETAFFWQLSPVYKGAIHLNIWNPLFYKLLYYCLIFCPIGYCLGLILKKIRGQLTFYLLFIISGIVAPILLLEILLMFETNRRIAWENLLLSFSITIFTFLWQLNLKKIDY